MPEVSSGTVAPMSRRGLGPGAGRISLPKPLTSFIGRERELAQAKRLLAGQLPGHADRAGRQRQDPAVHRAGRGGGRGLPGRRLLRPAGAGPGSGAGALDDRPEHRAAGRQGRPLMEHLVSQLRERQILIVLDNFEHLLAGAPVVTRLLQETSAVRILVSSRSSLRVSGEQECPVPPLAGPGPGRTATAASLAGLRVGAAVRRAGRRRGTWIHARRGERVGGRADRPQAGRPAAGHRAGGGAG